MGEATAPASYDGDARGRVLDGRWALGDEIGRGGAGVVHRAKDLVADRDVAVKILFPGPGAQPPRVRREVSALRLLRILGVVGLLDEGAHDGCPFLVMELVAGTPFPGVGRAKSWDSLAQVVERFLETLARVHAAGVLHRDLKPSNVLVDDEGRPTILDFGLSWGPSLGASVTEPGTVMGTPQYLAPEQLLGRPTDARTDLYSAGVMLYEALTGRLPHDADNFQELVQQRVARTPLPVRRLEPDVPVHVADVVDAMLAVRPDERPASAGEAVRRLFDQSPDAAPRPTLPRLGGRAALDAVFAALRSTRSVDVAGPRGSGRTRLLHDAAEELRREGRTVHWTTAGTRPLESLRRLAGALDDLAAADLDAALAAVDARIRTVLAAGTVVLADDADRLDAWSAAALERCRDAGGVVRAYGAGRAGAVDLPLLAEEDLRALFAGPDRVLHLREDAAREMWLRTGGVASRVEAEIAAWTRNGIAYFEDGRCVVRRSALDSIRGSPPLTFAGDTPATAAARSAHAEDLLASIALAWPDTTADLVAVVAKSPRWTVDAEIAALEEDGLVRRLADGRVQPLVVPQALVAWPAERRAAEHAAIAAGLPAGTASRCRHLLAAGSVPAAADEALVAADTLTKQGDTSGAAVLLAQSLAAVRQAGDPVRETRLLIAFANTTLYMGTVLALDQALYEVGRTRVRSRATEQLDRLLRGAADAARGNGEAALMQLDGCGPLDDPDLELWRQAQRHRAARSLSIEREQRVVDEIEKWAVARGDVRSLANSAAWSAQLRWRQGKYVESGEAHAKAADGSIDRTPARIAHLLNAAAALLEAGRYADVRTQASAAIALAASCRHHAFEACASSFLRNVAYRLDQTDAVDFELVAAADQVGEPRYEAMICLNEAAVAWRTGDLAAAASLASRATSGWRAARAEWPSLLSRCLELACGAPPNPGEFDALVARATECPLPGVAIQAMGLLAIATPERSARLLPLLRKRLAQLPPESVTLRREVLSLEEAVKSAGGRL
jgi:eukaryotic-like serine/threonine-protein kinase